MTKILKCPECGTDETKLFAAQHALRTYEVKANAEDRDGITTTLVDTQGFKFWYLGCHNCGAQSDDGESWAEGWLVEADDGEDPEVS